MGGPEKFRVRKAVGKLNVRERIEYFFDGGSFQELGLFTHSEWPGQEERFPPMARSSDRGWSTADRY